jgi:hypothetical protein
MSPQIQTCRFCGCTEQDCSKCIALTGHPCTWAQPDLCSRCADYGTPKDQAALILNSIPASNLLLIHITSLQALTAYLQEQGMPEGYLQPAIQIALQELNAEFQRQQNPGKVILV